MYNFKNKSFNRNERINFNFLFSLKVFFVFIPTLLFGDIPEQTHNNLTYSFFGETGETESAFTIAGRNFPVKVGSLGLKATYQPTDQLKFILRLELGILKSKQLVPLILM